jgi:hypothetical protein
LAVELLPALGERELHGSDRGRDHGRRNGPAAAVVDDRDRRPDNGQSKIGKLWVLPMHMSSSRAPQVRVGFIFGGLQFELDVKSRNPAETASAGCRAHRYRWRPVRLRFRRPELFGDLG